MKRALTEQEKHMAQVFGMRLKMLRTVEKVSVYRLAKEVGATASTMYKYETGYALPNSGTLVRLADRFNVPTDYLLGRTNRQTWK